MAFPDTIVTFPQVLDITATDAPLVKSFQTAMQNGNFTQAAGYLAQIPNSSQKLLGADFINSISTTVQAVETYFQTRYSPAYIVSSTQPTAQENTDFWFQIIT
jgi:hypothetical protein